MTHINQGRIYQEKKIVKQMIHLYCRKKEGHKELCSNCRALLEYSQTRLGRCPFGDRKPTCRLCTVHCYKPEMRKRMQEVMRYAGPRMILYYPVSALHHLIKELFYKLHSRMQK